MSGDDLLFPVGEERDRPLELEMPIQTTAGAWLAVHGVLCLGLRHPGLAGRPSAIVAKDFVEQLGEILVEAGVLTDAELALVQQTETSAVPTCEVCHCTPDRACEGGCSWDPAYAEAGRAVCDRCVGKAAPLVRRILTLEDVR